MSTTTPVLSLGQMIQNSINAMQTPPTETQPGRTPEQRKQRLDELILDEVNKRKPRTKHTKRKRNIKSNEAGSVN